MVVLVVFDSVYGNTEKIARSMGGALGGDVKVLRPGEVNPSDLNAADLLIIGAPTQGGRPTPAIQAFLERVPRKGNHVAVFDTRLSSRLVKIFGYAADRMAESLKRNGVELAAPPEGFFVKGKQGPLKEGETERAADWANGIKKDKGQV